MRTLLLLRGAPGSGKSTFVRENRLEQYTLEADRFRTLVSNPVLNEKGDFTISQRYDKISWKMLMECLEERMIKGDFTIIDATHSTKQSVKSYEDLAEKYKYSVYYYQFDTPYEICLENNLKRDVFKQVSENVIKRMYNSVQSSVLPNRFKRIYDINEIINFYVDDITGKYENVKIIGDIHSCYTALSKILEDFSEKTLYIFLGDYLDRGIEHKKTLDLFLGLWKNPNVILLEGNHEIHLRNFSSDLPVKSREFMEATLPAISENVTNTEEFKKHIRMFCKKMRQCYSFKFHNHKILCTHGGLSAVPDMALISAQDMIKGVGKYETEIGIVYEENYRLGKCQNYTQVHGHRGIESTEHSICLEGEVEFGGELKFLNILPEKIELNSVKNDVYDRDYLQHELDKAKNSKEINLTKDDEVNKLIISKLINVKNTKPNLYSLNFTRNAFKRKLWNDSTIKARGLFVDKITGEVKMRSYNKFFNYGENNFSSKKYLEKNLSFPVTTYEKYNGFLGILGVINDEFIFATKSTTEGEHARYFRKLFEKVNEKNKKKLFELCKNKNVSVIFEVVSNEDRHIVDYFMNENLFLLDVIENNLVINSIHSDITLSEKYIKELNINDDVIKVKKAVSICNDFEEVLDLMGKYGDIPNVEGLVFTDAKGLMFKYKAEHYNKWKRRRTLVELYRKNGDFSLKQCKNEEEKNFMKWIISLEKGYVENTHIVDLMNKYTKK